MITGSKEGLGKAYVRGMLHAIADGADEVFEMDSDFSHDPKDVPRLLAMLEKGYDFVIGSRYVKGGSIPKEWGVLRKLNSLGGNLVARYLAGIARIRDCTAGFRCIKTDLLQRIDLSTIKTQGYGFQVSLLHAAYIRNAKIGEIPVHFVDRTAGESKLGLGDIIEFVLNAAAIRMTSMATFIKFCIVGASGVAVNLGVFALLMSLGLNKYLASPLAIEVSILWNFMLNHKWTFRLRKTKHKTHVKGLRFNLVSLLALCISYGTFWGVTQAYPHLSSYLAQLAGIVPATLVNYFCNAYWTFTDKKPERQQILAEP
jgi:dolichol-phosphate mannosyltransferase